MWAASCLASCCAACACDACRTVVSGISRRSARIAYCGLFALSLIVSWILRQVVAPLMEKIPWINSFHTTPSREWFETDAVLRVSLGIFLFFTILAILMIGVKSQKDPRDSVHHGGWMMKIICWCILVIFMFFLPNGIISFYETISKFGSGLFLLVQVILLLDFVHSWNDKWVRYDEQFWYIALLYLPLGLWFKSESNALQNVWEWFETDAVLRVSLGNFLFFTILAILMIGVKSQKDPRDSLHHGGWMMKIICWCILVNGSIFPASLLSLYCTYLCYSALASEPRDYECNSLRHSKAVSTGALTIGLLKTVLSVVYSAVRAGSSTTLLSPPSSPRAVEGAGKPLLPLDKVDEEEEKEKAKTVTYSYSFFHIIFCLASMYSAMLLTGWSTSVGESGKLVDVGWPSVWVRLVTGWATAALFIWSQVAPILFPEREF